MKKIFLSYILLIFSSFSYGENNQDFFMGVDLSGLSEQEKLEVIAVVNSKVSAKSDKNILSSAELFNKEVEKYINFGDSLGSHIISVAATAGIEVDEFLSSNIWGLKLHN